MATPARGGVPSPPLVEQRDLWVGLLYLGIWLPAWLFPPSWWPRTAHYLSLVSALPASRRRAIKAQVPSPVFKHVAPDSVTAVRILDAEDFIERMELLRSLRPGGWWPKVEFVGRGALDAAIAAGRGAVVWVTPCVSSAVVSKLGLREAGFTVTHLSAATHGPSNSRIGVPTLGRLHVLVEEQLVRERVVMPRDGIPVAQMRRLRERLQANDVVTITVTSGGQQQARAPFLDSTLVVPTGAINLARASGAPLFPAFTIRTGTGKHRFVLGAEINTSQARTRDEALQLAVLDYARQLERFVGEHPALWRGWRYPMIQPRSPEATR